MSRANICIVVQLVVALAMPGEDAAPSWWGGLQNFQLRSRDLLIQHQNKPPVMVTITIDIATSAKLFNKSIMLPHRKFFIFWMS